MTTILLILLCLLLWKPLYHAIQILRIEDADSDTYHLGQIRAYFRDLWSMVKPDKGLKYK
jgi:hypothetical protein